MPEWLSGFNLQSSIMKIFTFILCLYCVTRLSAEDPVTPGKKERKEVARIFGEEVDFRRVPMSWENSELQPYLKQGDVLFEVVREKLISGYLLTTHTKGRYDYFDYSVIFSEELEVLGMMILVYRSTHGAGVCSKGWLKQFKGYTGGNLELGKEIDSISGATLSATSLVKDIQRCYQLMVILKNE